MCCSCISVRPGERGVKHEWGLGGKGAAIIYLRQTDPRVAIITGSYTHRRGLPHNERGERYRKPCVPRHLHTFILVSVQSNRPPSQTPYIPVRPRTPFSPFGIQYLAWFHSWKGDERTARGGRVYAWERGGGWIIERGKRDLCTGQKKRGDLFGVMACLHTEREEGWKKKHEKYILTI